MKLVTLREKETGPTFDRDATRTAMELPAERCLIPSNRVTAEGRTLWRVVEIVAAIHLGEPPGEGA